MTRAFSGSNNALPIDNARMAEPEVRVRSKGITAKSAIEYKGMNILLGYEPQIRDYPWVIFCGGPDFIIQLLLEKLVLQ